MGENEYGNNIIANGEGTSTTGWTVTNVLADGMFKITNGSMTQAKPITDDNRATAYKLSYNCIALRSVKSCFVVYFKHQDGTTQKTCTRLLPIQSTGVNSVRFEVPEGGFDVKLICQGDLDIKGIILQHDTGFTVQQKQAIADLAQFDIITSNTMIATACWFGTVGANYIETNFAALDTRCPMPPNNKRLYQRIWDERNEFIIAELSPSLTEDYKIIDPADPSKTRTVQVFYNAIGDHEDAYKGYTLTHPTKLYPDLSASEVDAYKVKCRKTISSSVKKATLFKEVTLNSGVKTVMPVDIWGEGTGEGDKGKCFSFKDIDGYTIQQMHENNSHFTGLKFGEKSLLQFNWITQKWEPIGGNLVGGIGNVIFHKDKVSLTNADLSNTNALHVAYSSTGNKIVGENSTIYTSGLSVLGVEVVTKAPPIDPPPKPVQGLVLPTNTTNAKYYLAYTVLFSGQYYLSFYAFDTEITTTDFPIYFNYKVRPDKVLYSKSYDYSYATYPSLSAVQVTQCENNACYFTNNENVYKTINKYISKVTNSSIYKYDWIVG